MIRTRSTSTVRRVWQNPPRKLNIQVCTGFRGPLPRVVQSQANRSVATCLAVQPNRSVLKTQTCVALHSNLRHQVHRVSLNTQRVTVAPVSRIGVLRSANISDTQKTIMARSINRFKNFRLENPSPMWISTLGSPIARDTLSHLTKRQSLGSFSASTPFHLSRKFSNNNNNNLPPHVMHPLPALSPTMEVGEIIEVLKKEGGQIAPGDALASVQTDKASIDWNATDDGYLAKWLIAPNVSVAVGGRPILITVQEKEDVKAFANYEWKEDAASSPQPAKQAETTEVQKKPQSSSSSPPSSPPFSASPSSSSSGTVTPPTERLHPGPAAYHLLHSNNIDWQVAYDFIAGTGPKGRLTKGDVQAFLESGGSVSSKATAQSPSSSQAQSQKSAAKGAVGQVGTHTYVEVTANLSEVEQMLEHFSKSDKLSTENLVRTAVIRSAQNNSELGFTLDSNLFLSFVDVDQFFPAPENFGDTDAAENGVCVIGVGRKVTKDLDVNFKPISQINLTAVSEQVLGKTEFELAQLMQSVKSYLENPHTML